MRVSRTGDRSCCRDSTRRSVPQMGASSCPGNPQRSFAVAADGSEWPNPPAQQLSILLQEFGIDRSSSLRPPALPLLFLLFFPRSERLWSFPFTQSRYLDSPMDKSKRRQRRGHKEVWSMRNIRYKRTGTVDTAKTMEIIEQRHTPRQTTPTHHRMVAPSRSGRRGGKGLRAVEVAADG